MQKYFLFFFIHLLAFITSLSAQVTLIKDINPGSSSSMGCGQLEMVNFSNRLFFPADDGSAGLELYRSAGSNSSTLLFSDLNPGSGGSNPEQLTVLGNRMFFTADNGINGRELYVMNSPSSIPLLLELVPGSSAPTYIRSFTRVGNDVYFIASTPAHGSELWKYNVITLAPPVPIESFVGSAGMDAVLQSYGNITHWGIYNELAYENVTQTLYWFGGANTAPTYTLWKYHLGDLSPSNVGVINSANPHLQPPVPLNGRVYFAAYQTGFTNYEMYYSDGSTIALFQDILPGVNGSFPHHVFRYGNQIRFIATRPGASPSWQMSMGIISNSHILSFSPVLQDQLYSDGFPDDNPFRVVSGQCLLQHGTKVYQLSGNGLVATQVLSNFFVGINESGLIKFGSKYFYSRYESNDKVQVYKDQGLGPVQVTSFDLTCHGPIKPMVVLSTKFYVNGGTALTGWELWRIDPATALIGDGSNGGVIGVISEGDRADEAVMPHILSSQKLNVLPNPGTDLLQVEIPNGMDTGEVIVTVYDLQQKVVFSNRYDKSTIQNPVLISINDWLAGQYIINVASMATGETKAAKFVKL